MEYNQDLNRKQYVYLLSYSGIHGVSCTNSPRIPVYCWGHKRKLFFLNIHQPLKIRIGLPKQKGINSYLLSANAQRPFVHAFHNAIFNTFRRCKDQFLYVVPPFVIAYWIMQWAEKR